MEILWVLIAFVIAEIVAVLTYFFFSIFVSNEPPEPSGEFMSDTGLRSLDY